MGEWSGTETPTMILAGRRGQITTFDFFDNKAGNWYLANLQMARATGRLRDLAIRSALGASRWMLIKQQLIESLILSAAGGVLGVLIAGWSNDIIGRNIRLGLTTTLELPIDGRVLGFTAGISIPGTPRWQH